MVVAFDSVDGCSSYSAQYFAQHFHSIVFFLKMESSLAQCCSRDSYLDLEECENAKNACDAICDWAQLFIGSTCCFGGYDVVEVLEADLEKNVDSLSIDSVVDRGLKRNSVLLLLEYQMEILDNQKSQTELDRDNTKSDLDGAIRKRREMRSNAIV